MKEYLNDFTRFEFIQNHYLAPFALKVIGKVEHCKKRVAVYGLPAALSFGGRNASSGRLLRFEKWTPHSLSMPVKRSE